METHVSTVKAGSNRKPPSSIADFWFAKRTASQAMI